MIQAGVIAGSPKGITVYVYGAGTIAVNGTYVEQGSYDGNPLYVSLDGLRMMWRNNGTGYYHINDFGDYDKNLSYYYDKSGAANPWEGTLWQYGVSGAWPVPTVSLTPEPPPTAMRFDGAGIGSGQPLNVPVTGVYNGKPEYFLAAGGSNDQIRARWTDECVETAGFAWVWSIRYMNRYHYWSSENVEYPHYVTAWTVTSSATPPTPTVTAVY